MKYTFLSIPNKNSLNIVLTLIKYPYLVLIITSTTSMVNRVSPFSSQSFSTAFAIRFFQIFGLGCICISTYTPSIVLKSKVLVMPACCVTGCRMSISVCLWTILQISMFIISVASDVGRTVFVTL